MSIPPHKILLVIALIAASAIIIDAIFESDLLRSLTTTTTRASHLAEGLSALWRNQQQEHSPPVEEFREDASTAHFVAVPLDHEDPNRLSFQNRYWINTEFYRPGGPVFVHDVGEANAASSAQRYLTNTNSYLRKFLAEFQAIGIVWEHRYYGESSPFPADLTRSIEHLRFLTLNQSLADLPYFARNFSLASLPNQDLTPNTTPWIMMGCSYSGLRAAISRSRYPETFLAAYAASAPVELTIDHNKFFEQIYQKLVDRGHSNCTADLHAVSKYIDLQLADPRNASTVKQQFLGPGADQNSNGDFTLAIYGPIYGHFQSQGLGRGNRSLASFCDYLEWDHTINSPAGSEGLASNFGIEFLVDRFASWPGLLPTVNKNFGVNCAGLNKSLPVSCNLGAPETDPGAISWEWQQCSELGLFSTVDPSSHAIMSSYQTVQYRQSLCTRLFSEAYTKGSLDVLPIAEQINIETGGRFMRPSNVFWTAGQYDPWRDLTPLVEGVNYTSQAHEDRSEDRETCETPTEKDDELFGYLFEDEQHCADYNTHLDSANEAREIFSHALKGWLKCFKKTRN